MPVTTTRLGMGTNAVENASKQIRQIKKKKKKVKRMYKGKTVGTDCSQRAAYFLQSYSYITGKKRGKFVYVLVLH
jgi:hypothetical protein